MTGYDQIGNNLLRCFVLLGQQTNELLLPVYHMSKLVK